MARKIEVEIYPLYVNAYPWVDYEPNQVKCMGKVFELPSLIKSEFIFRMGCTDKTRPPFQVVLRVTSSLKEFITKVYLDTKLARVNYEEDVIRDVFNDIINDIGISFGEFENKDLMATLKKHSEIGRRIAQYVINKNLPGTDQGTLYALAP